MASTSDKTLTAPRPLPGRPPQARLSTVLRPYRKQVVLLLILAIVANIFTLFVPWLIRAGVDSYMAGQFELDPLVFKFLGIAALVFFTCWQNVIQVLVSEKVAMDLRLALSDKISGQGYRFIEEKIRPSC